MAFKTGLQVPKFGWIMSAGSKVQFGSSRFGSRTVWSIINEVDESGLIQSYREAPNYDE